MARRRLADDVVEITLAPPLKNLPAWQPGAHLGITLPNGLIRHYSLTSSPTDPYWRFAVKREAASRGGSAYVHEHLAAGDTLSCHRPRSNFTLAPASEYLFVAAGIGITPLLSLAAAAPAPHTLLYIARDFAHAPYHDSEHIDELYLTGGGQRPDLDARIRVLPAGAVVYACGPASLLQQLERAAGEHGHPLHVEHFAARPASGHVSRKPFTVALARSAKTIQVEATESLLDALKRAGVLLPSSCREGLCGSCEVTVLDGDIAHADSILTDDERVAGDVMMACVSRAAAPTIRIDL